VNEEETFGFSILTLSATDVDNVSNLNNTVNLPQSLRRIHKLSM